MRGARNARWTVETVASRGILARHQAMNPFTSVAAALLLSLPGRAQDKTPREFHLANGATVKGYVVGLKDGRVQMKTIVFGNETDFRRKLADFAPASQIAIESSVCRLDDFDGQFAIARHAAQLGEMELTGVHARLAVKSVMGKPEEVEKTNQVKQWAAGMLEAKFEQLLAAGHVATARQVLDILSGRLADQVSEQKLAEMDERLQAVAAGRRAKPADPKSSPLADAERASLKKLLDAADKEFRTGLQNARKTVTAVKHYEAAIARYKQAWKEIEVLLNKHAGSEEANTELQDLSHHVVEGAKRAALQASTSLTMQSDYKGAMEWVNKILAHDPSDAQALAMQRTIVEAEAAASGDWMWGWRTAGGDPRQNVARPDQGRPR